MVDRPRCAAPNVKICVYTSVYGPAECLCPRRTGRAGTIARVEHFCVDPGGHRRRTGADLHVDLARQPAVRPRGGWSRRRDGVPRCSTGGIRPVTDAAEQIVLDASAMVDLLIAESHAVAIRRR